ncbi:MAG: hypothetical protein JRN21_05015 [Nitrososphaerota archaeon]|nr:hypothetical protein [Nitrososphaerota archaeon]
MGLPVANELIDLGSIVVLAVVVAGVLYKIRGGAMHHFDRWQVLKAPMNVVEAAAPAGAGLRSFPTVLFRDVFAAKVLDTCSRLKRASHLLLFWGFVSLAISTTLAFITNPTNVVLPLTDPVKLFGNAGGILIVAGFVFMFYVRYREQAPIWRLTRSDVFMTTLLLTVVTGFVTQQAVYAAGGSFWVSDTFWLHMIFVTVLLATAPFTKFFHAISKPVSILHDEVDARLGREPAIPVAGAGSKEESK